MMEIGLRFGVVCSQTYTSAVYPCLIDHAYVPQKQERVSLMDICRDLDAYRRILFNFFHLCFSFVFLCTRVRTLEPYLFLY